MHPSELDTLIVFAILDKNSQYFSFWLSFLGSEILKNITCINVWVIRYMYMYVCVYFL